jgi:hypothetical protein
MLPEAIGQIVGCREHQGVARSACTQYSVQNEQVISVQRTRSFTLSSSCMLARVYGTNISQAAYHTSMFVGYVCLFVCLFPDEDIYRGAFDLQLD